MWELQIICILRKNVINNINYFSQERKFIRSSGSEPCALDQMPLHKKRSSTRRTIYLINICEALFVQKVIPNVNNFFYPWSALCYFFHERIIIFLTHLLLNKLIHSLQERENEEDDFLLILIEEKSYKTKIFMSFLTLLSKMT